MNKDFRRTVDIKKVLLRGNNQRRIFLPSEEFTYGKRNRTPTPIKQVVGYEYARNAENDIRTEYNSIMLEVIIYF